MLTKRYHISLKITFASKCEITTVKADIWFFAGIYFVGSILFCRLTKTFESVVKQVTVLVWIKIIHWCYSWLQQNVDFFKLPETYFLLILYQNMV